MISEKEKYLTGNRTLLGKYFKVVSIFFLNPFVYKVAQNK